MVTDVAPTPEKRQSPPSTEILCLEKENDTLLENKKARTIAISCIQWFNVHPSSLGMFVRTIRRQESFSLRIVDYLVTNYAKRNRITIYHDGLPIDLYNDYRRFLGVFTKKYFDPFARRERLLLRVSGETLSSTVGQMNFMRWMLQREVHLRVQDLKKEVEMDMREHDGKRERTTTVVDASNAEEEEKSPQRFLVYNGPFRITF